MPENPQTERMHIGKKIDPNSPLDYEFIFSYLPTVDEVLLSAKADDRFLAIYSNPKNFHPSEDEMKSLIDPALKEIHTLECAARDPNIWNIDENKARSISLIVDFSAPGKYRYPTKHDAYEKFIFAWGMERDRGDAAARAGISIAGRQTGRDLSAFTRVKLLTGTNKELNNLRSYARKSIEESGLRFLYLGKPEEGESIRKVISSPESYVPSQSIDIIDYSNITNTVDQVMKMKEYLYRNLPTVKPGSKILFVCHSPQVMRSMRIIEKQQAVPPGITLSVLPLPIPSSGMKIYPEMEIKGMLGHYMTRVGSTQSCSYEIFGKIT